MRKSLIAALLACSAITFPIATTPVMRPSAAWNGTAGSGYGGTPPTSATFLQANNALYGVPFFSRPEYGYLGDGPSYTFLKNGTSMPVTPATAPLMHWVAPYCTDEMFSSDLTVAVSAFSAAADGLAGGITSFAFLCEGNVIPVAAPTLFPVPLWGGGTRLFPCYQAQIPFDALPDRTSLDLYAMATGLAGTRVIGPMRVYRKKDFDKKGVVTTGATQNTSTAPAVFPTLQAALAFYGPNQVSGEHIGITFSKDTIIDPGKVGSSATATPFVSQNGVNYPTSAGSSQKRGKVVVDGSGVNVTIQTTAINAGVALPSANLKDLLAFNPTFNGLKLRNMAFDIANFSSITGVQNYLTLMQFEYVDFFSSNGSGELPGTNGVSMQPRNLIFFGPYLALAQCRIRNLTTKDCQVSTRIGCRVDDIQFDSTQLASQLPHLLICNEDTNVSGAGFSNPLSAIQLAYSGSGTPTYDIVGTQFAGVSAGLTLSYSGSGNPTFDITGTLGNYVTPRTLTLRDGTNTQSFAATSTMKISDLVASINSYGNGWTAVGTSGVLAMFMGINPGPNYAIDPSTVVFGQAISLPIITSQPRTLVLRVDGTGVAAFSTTNVPGQNIYKTTDLTAAVNAFGNGWSATDTGGGGARMAATILTVAVIPAGGKPPDARTNQLLSMQVATGVDIHCDVGQVSQYSSIENALIGWNYYYQVQAQSMLNTTADNRAVRMNMAFLNICFENDTSDPSLGGAYGQMSGHFRHVLVAHCSTLNQGLQLRPLQDAAATGYWIESTFDALCRVDANFLDFLTINTLTVQNSKNSSETTQATIPSAFQGTAKRNVAANRYAGLPDQNNGTTWSLTTLVPQPTTNAPKVGFATQDTADFPALASQAVAFTKDGFKPSAQGKLRLVSSLVAPQISWDIEGRPRLPVDLVGAVALAA